MIVVLVLKNSAFSGVPSGLRVSVVPLNTEYSATEKIMMNVSYTNTSSQNISVLRWNTVLDGRVDIDFLSLVYAGKALSYTGRVYKRLPPTSRDYIDFKPGETRSVDVDISTGYNVLFKGEYSLAVKGLDQAPYLNSPVIFTLREDRAVTESDQSFKEFKRNPVFDIQPAGISDHVVNCSADTRVATDNAILSAERIVRISRDDLRNTPANQRSSAKRFNEWFGKYSDGRWATVQSHFDEIYSAVSSQTLFFLCIDPGSRDFNVFAYVYPSKPFFIYLGGGFLSASETGTDSKSGTIIHELSHFSVVASTDDHVYGQRGARQQALSNPNLAVDNADNHEYFTENTPFLSMPSKSIGGDGAGGNDPVPETASQILSAILYLLLGHQN